MSAYSDLIQCLNAYNKLLNLSYHFVIGRKNKAVEINIKFSKNECFHLLGLQYLSDIPQLKSNRSKIYDDLFQDNSQLLLKVINSDNYNKIEERIKSLQGLETFLDSNKTVFKFNDKANTFSLIQADYIMKNATKELNLYLFISKNTKEPNDYFCRSFFPRSTSLSDYSKGHTSYTLLLKEKSNITTNEIQLLYKSPSYNCIDTQVQKTQTALKPAKPTTAYFSRKQLNTSAQKIKEKEKLAPQQPTHKKSQELE